MHRNKNLKLKVKMRGENYGRRANGYAAIITTIMVMVVSLIVLSGLSFLTLQEVNINREAIKSVQTYYAAESGLEDAAYRLISGKNFVSGSLLKVGSATVKITSSTAGGQTTFRAEGRRELVGRNLETKIALNTTGVNFNFGVQVGEGGLEMENNSKVVGSIYSNGNIEGSSGATITGDVIVATGISPNPSVEWVTQDRDFLFATTSASRDIAQSFTANASGKLNKVSVYLGKIGSPSDITLRITNDNAGIPKTSIANATIPVSSVGAAPSWIDVSFSSAPNLTSGTKYWIVLDYGSNSASHYWNWRMDSSDGYANNTGKYTSDWNAANAVWTNVGGDLDFRVWIGGVNNKIDTVTVGTATTGTAYADLFVNTNVHGSSCPNPYCITDQSQPQQPLPISEGVIQDFRDEAASGGTINGDYSVTSNISLGPKKINGNLLMTSNNKTLTVTGTIYVTGYIDISNGSTIKCASSFGANSCVVLSDGWIHIQNNSDFSGSGQSGSFIMLLSTLACDGTSANPPCDVPHHHGAIDLHNNAAGAIFYASRGLLNLHNGVHITEATAYKLHLDQNAVVTYDQGLANANFSSGPSGGYSILYWREVQ